MDYLLGKHQFLKIFAYAIIIALASTLFTGKALAYPPDYRLPFVGSSVITTGPGCSNTHQGQSFEAIDFSMPENSAVYATQAGEIVFAVAGSVNNHNNDGFGNLMKIRHDDGNVSWYAHLNAFTKTSGRVGQGEQVAASGNTGHSTGPHLHFEVRAPNNQSISIRDLPGIAWYSGSVYRCQPFPNPDGEAIGPPLSQQGGHLRITNVRFSPTQLAAGATLEVRVDVVNDGNSPLGLAGPDNATYDENGGGWRDGACGLWRVGVDFDGRASALVDHPYRFGRDETLSPGEARTLGGYIRLSTPRTAGFWAGVVQECNHWEQDGAGRAQISVNAAGGAFQPDPAKTYRIVSVSSGKAMDVEGARQDNGAVIHQWDYAGGQNQRWRFQDAGDGYFYIRAAHSGKCIDVRDVSVGSGAALQQWDCVGGDNQKWRLDMVEGAVVLVAKHSQKVADVPNASANNGAIIAQWDRHNGANQRWRVEEVH